MKVAFRTDASLLMGIGHVVRCKTLADELRNRGAEVRFICREHSGNLIPLLRDAGCSTTALPLPQDSAVKTGHNSDDYAAWLGVGQWDDAKQTLEALRNFDPDWLVVDHYGLDAAWEQILRPKVKRVFVIDDLANRHHDCDLLLDQNYYTDMDTRYAGKVPAHCRLLLGPRFALLRPEFRKARESLRVRDGTVRRILVFFGGVDPTGETGKVLEALRDLDRPDIAVDVVVGATNPRADNISNRCDKMLNVTFHRQVTNMAELMAASDVSFGAGGSTQWERCSVGLPTVVTAIAANQTDVTRDLAASGIVLTLGSAEEVCSVRYQSALDMLTKEQLQILQSAGLALVDGRGLDRVVLSMCREPVQLRHAAAEDAVMVWPWRNHPETRRYFENTSPVSLAEHCDWWNNTIASRTRILLLGSQCKIDLGVLRFDLEKSTAVVSIYMDPALHGLGLGLGTALLSAGAHWLCSNHPSVRKCKATILPANVASKRAFYAAGYHEDISSGQWEKSLYPGVA